MMVWRQCFVPWQQIRRAPAIALAGVVVALASCTGGDGPPDVSLLSIDLTPASATLQVAATQQFTATGRYSDGGTASVSVTWTATGGTISSTGVYTAGSVAGNYQVLAREEGGSVSKAAAVTLTAAPPVLTSISVAPSAISLAPAATQQFTATGHYSDGSTNPGVPVDWTAAGGTINATGVYTAGSTDGSYQVTATAAGTSVAGSGAVTVTTPPPGLVAIEVSPPGVRILPYITQQYTAVGRRSDSTTVPVSVTWSVTFSPLTTIHNTITPSGVFQAGTVLDTFIVTATQVGGSLSGSVPVNVHSTSGVTVSPVPFAFWNPEPGKVYLCTSNHFTDDPPGLGGVAATLATPSGGVTAPSVSYTNLGPRMDPDGSGEVKVVCQEVWSAPPAPDDAATVTITVSENPGSGMAKVFNYTRLQCFTPPVSPDTVPTPRPCTRTDFTDQQSFEPNWRTTPVSATVTVSATTGANIWFKNTLVP